MTLHSQVEPDLKLSMLVICEKVLFERSGMPSLINIFRQITVPETEETQQEGAALSLSWSIYVAWSRLKADNDFTFSQLIQIFLPDGTLVTQTESEYIIPTGETQARVATNTQGFPIWQSGNVTIKVSIRDYPSVHGETSINIIKKKEPNSNETIAI